MSRSLTIVGASVRAAARSAVRAGFAVRAADLFADADLCRLAEASRVERYPAGLRAVVAARQDGPWMYCGALENEPALVDSLAAIRPLWGNAGAVLRQVRHPLRLAAALDSRGLARPQVSLGGARVPRDGRWLCKPRRSAAGAQVAFWTADTPAPRSPRTCYFQQFVEGAAVSAVFVGAAGKARLLGVTRQLIGAAWTGAAGFRYCGSLGPLALEPRLERVFTEIGACLAERFGLRGLFGVDAVINAAGVWPVEVNPRFTASVEILERALGFSAVACHATACVHGRLPEPAPAAGRTCGKAILFAEAPLTIDAAWNARALADRPPSDCELADVPRAGARIETGWPIVTLLVDGADEAAVLQQLRGQAARLRGELLASEA